MKRLIISIISFIFFILEFAVNVLFAISITFYNLMMVFIHCFIHYHERIEGYMNPNFRSMEEDN